MKDQKKSNFGLGVGLAVGAAAAGALAGMLLSPKSGKQNREMVTKKLQELEKLFHQKDLDKKVKEIFGEVTSQTKELYIKATTELSHRVAQMHEALGEIDKDKYAQSVSEVIDTMVSERKLPEKQLAGLKKNLLSDYTRIVEAGKKAAKPLKTVKAVKKTVKKAVSKKKVLAKK